MFRGSRAHPRTNLDGDHLAKLKMGWSIRGASACVVAAATLLTASCASQSERGAASCVPPKLRLNAPSAHAGDVIDLHGEFFVDTCADTSQSTSVEPQHGLTVSLLEGGRSRSIGRVDAQGTRGTFLLTLRLPPDLKRGLATIRVGVFAEVPFTVT